jgi:hypothetical protein
MVTPRALDGVRVLDLTQVRPDGLTILELTR